MIQAKPEDAGRPVVYIPPTFVPNPEYGRITKLGRGRVYVALEGEPAARPINPEHLFWREG